jgi:ATP-dependent Lon protease
VKIKKIEEQPVPPATLEIEALIRNVKEQVEKIISLGKPLSPDIMVIIENIDEPGRLADLVTSNIGFKIEENQQILEIINPIERLKKVNELLNKEVQLLEVQAKIQNQAKEEISKSQREYFLREQMRAIQQELGETDDRYQEIEEYREKIKKAKMPKEVEEEALKQLKRLEMMHPDSAESAIVRTYLDWMVELPWSKETKDKLDIKRAAKILDEDHYDLEKIKERILEFLSVRKLKKKMKGPILCFVGPPGVGKTSLGKSIARALGRKFVRISLGGLRDEAEIRGHRRTYVGALPGRIIQGIKQAGTNNPVFMLDEIDKIGVDFRGDPAAALLEVLDPEQNFSFSDHYLNVPFDLSNVMFITTANQLDPIPPALKDRMEVISLSGYTEEEKVIIAKKYLIPRQIKENGLNQRDIKFEEDAIRLIINQYTQEAGLRNLERQIGKVCRKVARKKAEGYKKPITITAKDISKFLGAPIYLPEVGREPGQVGIATGLAWTPYGGDVLYVEASVVKGKGNLILTGQLGDVMKESAQAALTYARSKAKDFNIDEEFYTNSDIHIHIPEGAIPKDGPSAGITMLTALISALSKIPVKTDLAMTGEITLRGRVLPVGGIREKSLAALSHKIKTVIIPHENDKDLEDLPEYVKKEIKFIKVKKADEVLKYALEMKKRN